MTAAFKCVLNAESSVRIIVGSRKLSAENGNKLLFGNRLNIACVVKRSKL